MVSKSFQVFSSFSETEKEDLLLFIKSIPLSQRCNLLKLFDFYYKTPIDTNVLPKKEMISSILKNGNDSQLRLLQSNFQKVMEKYIVWKSMETDSSYSRKALIDHYKKKGLKNVQQKTINQQTKSLDAQAIVDLRHAKEKLDLAEEAYNFAILSRKQAIKETEQLISQLDYYYILKKLKLSCMVISQENVYNLSFDHGLKKATLAYIEKNNMMEDPLIGAYYFCYQMLSENQVGKNFMSFFYYLEQYQHSFSHDENTQLYSLAINYCIRSLNQGNKEIGRKGLDLYTSSLKNGILLSNGKISKFTFRNIITMAIRLEEYSKAEIFIDKYKQFLDRKDVHDMVQFTTALLMFSKKQYESASNELLKIQFKDLLFNLASKVLLLKIFYEQNEMLVLKSHLDALQIFLKRHQSLGYHKQNYQNIIALTRKLINAKSLEKLKKLEKLIDDESHLTEKKWLREKVEEKKRTLSQK